MVVILHSCGTAKAYEQMTPREYYKMQAQSKTTVTKPPVQNLSVLRFRKTGTEGFARFTFLAENNYRKRMLRGLRAALINTVRRNGRNFDRYFKADAAYMSSK